VPSGHPRLKLALLAAVAVAVAGVGLLLRPSAAPLRGGPLLVDDPRTLLALEERGLSFARVVGKDGLAVIHQAVTDDMAELTKSAPADSPRRPFHPEWLTRGSFELVGVVNRIDRRAFDPTTCGEVRLVYRLALKGKKRPITRLPMTVNVRIPQPKPRGADCRAVAERWLSTPDVAGLVNELPRPTKIEINFQSIHVPATEQDMDDNAEYVLRAFDVDGRKLVRGHLFNTPRADLDQNGRAKLLAWIEGHLAEIDEGTAVVPDELLATRITSVSPRGLVHPANRPFSQLVGEPRAAIGHLALEQRARARTPELLLRRLDELTCVGCHQTRGIAGFHLLGEERDAQVTFNALAVGHSPHLGADLGWRALDLASVAKGERAPVRPFAAFPDGREGAECGLVPGLAAFPCAPELVCRDIHHGTWGICARKEGGTHAGEPCEDVDVTPDPRLLGALVRGHGPDATCPAPIGAATKGAFCAPNWLGFTGGMCSETCSRLGDVQGGSICAPLPSAGYEADCFRSREPIETCLDRHFAFARVARCDAATPCRDDYGCARVSGAPAGTGGCVPPYFIFQARVDGPLLDR
jgi:hypothetical protein